MKYLLILIALMFCCEVENPTSPTVPDYVFIQVSISQGVAYVYADYTLVSYLNSEAGKPYEADTLRVLNGSYIKAKVRDARNYEVIDTIAHEGLELRL